MKHKNYTNSNIDKYQLPLIVTKKGITDIICQGFVSANIPLYKLRNSGVIDMFNSLGITPPSESSVRNRVEKIRQKFNDIKFYLIVDESQIHCKKYVNIIIGNIACPNDYYLVEVIELSGNASNKNISISVDDCIKFYGLKRDNFRLLISDAAKNLKAFYCNMKHITCFSQLCIKIKMRFKNVDYLIASIKGLVNKNPSRKKLFSEVGRIPDPIVTRWGSWINAALFYVEHFEEVSGIVNEIKDDGDIIE